jgi:uncharacterized membrane protein YeaQ/YmgE (transglycosylase-associated protein family)
VVVAARSADAGAMLDRTIGAAIFGAVVGAWLGRALFKWILDLEGATLIAAVAATAVVAAAVCGVAERQSARPPNHP